MSTKKWSHKVTEQSDALELEEGIFTWNDPRKIAISLKKSSESSKRRKAGSYQSAMSMLNFYLNRGGSKIPADQKRTLNKAKDELKALFK